MLTLGYAVLASFIFIYDAKFALSTMQCPGQEHFFINIQNIGR